MSSGVTKLPFLTNNPHLESFLLHPQVSSSIHYTSSKHSSPYFLVLIDLQASLESVSQLIIDAYRRCRDNHARLAVVLLHGSSFEPEQNLRFTNLLDQLAGQTPLHRLIIVPCLFSHQDLIGCFWFTRLLSSAISTHQINISPKGNHLYYPLDFSDFETALLKSIFLSGTSGNTFWLLGNPISDVDLAYLLRKHLRDHQHFDLDINTSSEVELTPLNIYHNLSLEAQAKLNWSLVVELEDALLQYIKISSSASVPDRSESLTKYRRWSFLLRMVDKIRHHHQKIQRIQPKMLLKKVFFEAVGVIALIYLGLSLVYSLTVYFSFKEIEKTLFYFRKGDISQTTNHLSRSRLFLRVGEFNYYYLSPVFQSLSPLHQKKNQDLISFLNYTHLSVTSLIQTYSLAEKIYFSIGHNNLSLKYEDISLALKSNLQLAFENISQIEILLSQSQLPVILEDSIKNSFEYRQLKDIQEQLGQLTKIVDLIPVSLSGDLGKNLLIVFQNTHEERASGGVIEALLHITLDNGRFVSSQVYTSSQIDSLLGAGPEPPPLVRNLTGSAGWRVRDLGYNPDFPQTATNLSWFIANSLKFSPDTVIFVDEVVVSQLVDLFGGVTLDQVKLTGAQFQQLLQRGDSVRSYSPVVSDLATKLLNHEAKFMDLLGVLSDALNHQRFLFWTSDFMSEKNLVNQSYIGGVRSYDCHSGMQTARQCLSQTTHLSISNFSAIPLNSFLTHQITHQVHLEPKSVDHRYLVDYAYTQNTSLLNRDLIEVYQLYVPTGSIIKSITVDNQPIGLSGLLAQPEIGLDRYQFPISTSLNVPHRIIIDFAYPLAETLKLPVALSLTEIRQPSSHAADITLEIFYPSSIRPSAVTANIDTKSGQIIYRYPSKTSTFAVHFVPNQI